MVPPAIIIVVEMVCVLDNMKWWLIGDILYLLLIVCYHGKGLYGIGLAGITLDGTQPHYDYIYTLIYIGIIAIYLIVVELLIKLILVLLHKVIRNNHMKN